MRPCPIKGERKGEVLINQGKLIVPSDGNQNAMTRGDGRFGRGKTFKQKELITIQDCIFKSGREGTHLSGKLCKPKLIWRKGKWVDWG